MTAAIVQTLLQGLLLGGLYCLFALGQSLMFGVMRLTNTAQGDFIILGAFAAIAAMNAFAALGWMHAGAPVLVLVLLVPLAFGFGYVLQRYVLNGTLGRAFRAVSDDKEIAELMGLASNKVYALATAIAFVLIAVAGLLQGMRTTVSPADGPLLLLFAFEAVIIGGMGSFWGTLLGALLLGITQQIGFRLDPGWGIWMGHIVFLLVLVLRPQGLFPKTRG